MVFLKSILFIGIFAAAFYMFTSIMGSMPCTKVVETTLHALQSDDTETLLRQFGENSCHCQPRGGYKAYLKYESGENDNIAFLNQHKFSWGALAAHAVPTIEKQATYHMPGNEPESEEVDVPVTFDPKIYSPYFLPLDSAYGHSIKEQDLRKFCLDPSNNFWQAISLRLRPSLDAGLVPAGAQKQKNGEPEYMADLFAEVLPKEQAKYLRPEDAGPVTTPDGKNVAAVAFEKSLPRLKRGVLRFYVGRRGKFERWAVKKIRLKDPVFTLVDGKELVLKTPEDSLTDIHGPAAPSAQEVVPAVPNPQASMEEVQ